jgi:hypothetical protein
MLRYISLFFSLFLTFGFFSCNEDEQTAQIISAFIGESGGSITSADGRLTLDIPDGALTEDTEISIRRLNQNELPPDSEGTLLAYELLPDGLQFLLPVTASLEVDVDINIEDGVVDTELPVITLLNSSGGVIEILENQLQNTNLDTGISTISGKLNHFSTLEATIEIPDPNDIFIGNPNIVIRVSSPCVISSGDTFEIFTEVKLNTFGNQEKLGAFTIAYEDSSTEPIRILKGGPSPFFAEDIEQTRSTTVERRPDYDCLDVGEGIFRLLFVITVEVETTPGNFETLFFEHEVEKEIECVDPEDPVIAPTPTPTPTPSPTPTPEPTPEPPQQIATFDIFPIGPINFTHNKGITPCPQAIAILEITNTGSQKTLINVSSNSSFIDFGLAPLGNPPSLSGGVFFELEPGETRSVVVFFNCKTTQNFIPVNATVQ